MPDYLDEADRAITRVLEDLQPDDANNWRSIVPATKWGVLQERWPSYLRPFRREFLNEISPKKIKEGEVWSGFRVKPLRELQQRMSDSVEDAA